jgi:hypothetical protein
MAKKFTVEMKGQALKDLGEIAGLCKETPEALLVRAFREWVELREDMEDVAIAEAAIAEYERTGESYSLEEVMRDRGLTPRQTREPRIAKPRRTARARG